jgi:hypothetical protein
VQAAPGLFNKNIPCWGAYSYKAVRSTKPGQREAHLKHAAFLLSPAPESVDAPVLGKNLSAAWANLIIFPI